MATGTAMLAMSMMVAWAAVMMRMIVRRAQWVHQSKHGRTPLRYNLLRYILTQPAKTSSIDL
jgi:ABC-type Co2+ transport system permease subunit